MRFASTAYWSVPVPFWRYSVTPAEMASLAISSLPFPVKRTNGSSGYASRTSLRNVSPSFVGHVVVADDAVDVVRLEARQAVVHGRFGDDRYRLALPA